MDARPSDLDGYAALKTRVHEMKEDAQVYWGT